MDPANQLLNILDGSIRRSVVSGSFAQSRALLDRYFAEVEALVASCQNSPEQLVALRDRTQALCEWAAAMVRMSKSQLSCELARVQSLNRYHHSARTPRHFHAHA